VILLKLIPHWHDKLRSQAKPFNLLPQQTYPEPEELIFQANIKITTDTY